MNINEVESDGHFAALRKRLLKHALYMIVTQSIVLYQGAHASINIYIYIYIIKYYIYKQLSLYTKKMIIF